MRPREPVRACCSRLWLPNLPHQRLLWIELLRPPPAMPPISSAAQSARSARWKPRLVKGAAAHMLPLPPALMRASLTLAPCLLPLYICPQTLNPKPYRRRDAVLYAVQIPDAQERLTAERAVHEAELRRALASLRWLCHMSLAAGGDGEGSGCPVCQDAYISGEARFSASLPAALSRPNRCSRCLKRYDSVLWSVRAPALSCWAAYICLCLQSQRALQLSPAAASSSLLHGASLLLQWRCAVRSCLKRFPGQCR